jgi:hypothetical protein
MRAARLMLLSAQLEVLSLHCSDIVVYEGLAALGPEVKCKCGKGNARSKMQ